MNRHAKEPSAGSTERNGKRRLGGLLAILALALCALGSGAPAAYAIQRPSVSMGTVSNPSYATAHVTGEVTGYPDEVTGYRGVVLWVFEISTDGTDWQPSSLEGIVEIEADTTTKTVSGDLQNLRGGTTYKVRLSAHCQNEACEPPPVSTLAPYPEFTTLPVDPPAFASADAASNVSYASAKATGKVQAPSGNSDPAFDVACRFEYIPDQQFNENVANSELAFANASSVDCVPNPIEAEEEGSEKQDVEADLSGLSLNTTYHLRLHAENAGGVLNADAPSTFTTLNASAPVVTIDPVTTLDATTAHFSGHVTPGGSDPVFATDWEFRCTPDCPGLTGHLDPGTVPVEVKADAKGLEPNTAYQVELVATNSGGQASAGPVSFKTDAAGPDALTIPAFVLEGGTSALVGARVNPHNSPTTWWIEYGTTDNYGQSVPVSEDAAAGSGGQFQFLTQALTGLSLGTTYHFRVTAENDIGKIHGEDRTFKTPPPAGPPASCPNEALRTGPSANLPDCRAYEDVTSLDLNGAGVFGAGGGPQRIVAEDGEAALWTTRGVLPGFDSTGIFDTYRSRRTPDGWTSDLASPPRSLASSILPIGFGFSTANLDRTIWGIEDANDPENPGGPALYRGEPDGSFAWLSRGSESETGRQDSTNFVGVSSDGLKVFFGSFRQIEPGAGKQALYERIGNSTTVIRDENGDPMQEAFLVSADGSVATTSSLTHPGLYVYRKDLGHAVYVAQGGAIGLSSDGTRLFFATPESLAPGDEDSAVDVYEYGVFTGNYKLISAGPGLGNGEAAAAPLLSSPDRSAVYFTSTEQLDGDKGASGEPNLYVAEGDGIHYAITPAGGDVRSRRLSPDGKKLLFESSDRLTAYDNAGKTEIYVYDSADGATACASCRPDGESPTGDANFGTPYGLGSNVVEGTGGSDTEGQRIFFQTTDPILPEDTNKGKSDVYEFDAESNTVSLISTGHSSSPSWLYGNGGPEGRDVFFLSSDSLMPDDQNVGAQKLYDARSGGGFAAPPAPVPCEGEGCRGPGSATPGVAAAPTSSFSGPGNPKHKKHHKKHKRHHHKKRKHKGHKKHHATSQTRDANRNGRTGR